MPPIFLLVAFFLSKKDGGTDIRERKILKRFKETPVSPVKLLAVEFTIYVLYAAVSMLTIILMAILIWKVKIHGSWFAFWGSWILTMVSTLSIGMMVGHRELNL